MTDQNPIHKNDKVQEPQRREESPTITIQQQNKGESFDAAKENNGHNDHDGATTVIAAASTKEIVEVDLESGSNNGSSSNGLSMLSDRSKQPESESILASSAASKFTPRKKHKWARTENSKNDQKWMEMFEALKVYKQQHGDCLVPNYYANHEKLGIWVKTQRYQYRLLNEGKRKAKISNERVNMLNNIGFVWDVYKIIGEENRKSWDKNLQMVKMFRVQNSHCKIPSKYPPHPNLSSWLARQRAHYRLREAGLQSSMTALQAKQFERVVLLGIVGDDDDYDDMPEQQSINTSCNESVAATVASMASSNTLHESQSNICSTCVPPPVSVTLLSSNALDAEAAKLLEQSLATAATCAAASLIKFADVDNSNTSLLLDQPVIINVDEHGDTGSLLNDDRINSSSSQSVNPLELHPTQVSLF